MSNWISVRNEYPKSHERVIVWDSSLGRATIGYVIEGESPIFVMWAILQDREFVVSGVVYWWQPLPIQPD